jgi:S-adenosylmethionine/arginine decarboxylase-like enzyme
MSKGRHLILDLYGCSPDILNDYGELECLLETALNMAGATILRIFGEKFEPQGVTLLALLAESHASLFTHGLSWVTVLSTCILVGRRHPRIRPLSF